MKKEDLIELYKGSLEKWIEIRSFIERDEWSDAQAMYFDLCVFCQDALSRTIYQDAWCEIGRCGLNCKINRDICGSYDSLLVQLSDAEDNEEHDRQADLVNDIIEALEEEITKLGGE